MFFILKEICVEIESKSDTDSLHSKKEAQFLCRFTCFYKKNSTVFHSGCCSVFVKKNGLSSFAL